MPFRFPGRSRGPSCRLSIVIAPGTLSALVLWGCSLSLEDPAQEATDKLAKVIPARMELMIGRWIADSTYTADDTRATSLRSSLVRFDLRPDTGFVWLDTIRAVFHAKNAEGRFGLVDDTLVLAPSTGPSDTFIVRLRFLGNYLELQRASDARYAFFHKVKPLGEKSIDSLLGNRLWALHGKRPQSGKYVLEPKTIDFDYLRFGGDSMFSDMRRNGIVRVDSGPLGRDGTAWTWKAAGGARAYFAETPSGDTLRLWPLSGGRADSGYLDYLPAERRHPRDVDMRPFIGHLRGDSLRDASGAFEYHYGRYYDLILESDHKARVETNMAGVPRWDAWSLDSGWVRMSAAGKPSQRMRADTSGGRLRLRIDSGAYYASATTYTATRVAGDFADRPLARFDSASYLTLDAGGAVREYHFSASNDKDRFEIFARSGPDAYWAGFVLPPDRETYQSGQAEFFLAFEDSTGTLGRFTCRSRPDLDLVLRQTVGDPAFSEGFIQGACAVQKADSVFADSTLHIEGAFKLRRARRGGFGYAGWSLP